MLCVMYVKVYFHMPLCVKIMGAYDYQDTRQACSGTDISTEID